MNETKVTVLMPTFNTGKYIADAIRSVLAQEFPFFELLIINDGSTDDTLSILQQFSDPRIHVLHQSRAGIGTALNNGLLTAKGEYIARFDADDICLPDRLQLQADFLDSNPAYVLTGCDAEYISESSEHLFNFSCAGHTHEEIMERLYTHCPFIHSGVMYRKEAVLKTGGYPAGAHNFEDHLLWVQLTKSGRYHNLPRQLIKVRINPGSATIDEKWRGHRFAQLKRAVIRRGFITTEESNALLAIIRSQDIQKIKEGAYYALCGKKFLVNNHQPGKARSHLARAIYRYPFRLDNYMLYMLSYFPSTFIHWLHRKRTDANLPVLTPGLSNQLP